MAGLKNKGGGGGNDEVMPRDKIGYTLKTDVWIFQPRFLWALTILVPSLLSMIVLFCLVGLVNGMLVAPPSGSCLAERRRGHRVQAVPEGVLHLS